MVVTVHHRARPMHSEHDRLELMMDDLEDLLTTGDVAAITRSPASTVRYWRHLGCGPRGFTLGRRVVYRRRDVLAWLAEREDAGGQPAN